MVPMKRLLALALLTVGLAPAASSIAHAQTMEQGQTRSIMVAKDKSAAFRLFGPVGEVVVASPEIAQLVATTDRSFYVRGKAVGSTNVLVYDPQRRLVEVIDVRVGADTSNLQADLAAALPGEKITARHMADGVMLTGTATTAAVAAKANAIAERFAPKAVTSMLVVQGSEQVMLEVRVLEASRSALRELGIDLSVQNLSGFIFGSGSGLLSGVSPQAAALVSTNSGTVTIDVLLRALEEKGVVRTLAKPNLVALSGEQASFLAGGEFPFPIPVDEDTIAVEFRPFGVNLNFAPLVQEGGLIRLKVAPEVSQLNFAQGLRVNGVNVPGLTTRRASTTVELRDGESFAIAGLFQQEYTNAVRQIPWISEVPIIGALFRSAQWRRQETELVIIVTPRLIQPTRDPSTLPDPLRGRERSEAALVLQGKALDKPLTTPVGGARP
jgi:pilus assembly protein CpaC